MRILMISDVYFPRINGVSTSIQTFRRGLHAAGHETLLIAPEYPAGATDHESGIVRVPSRYLPRDPEDRAMKLAAVRALSPQLERGEFDLVHIQTPFIAHYQGVSLARALRVPVIETYHTYFEEYLHHYVPLLPRAVMRFAARRFTVSQCNALDALVVPSRAMEQALLDYGVQCPMHVGRIAHEKNIDFLFRMFAEVLRSKPDAVFIVAGEGPALASCKAHVRSLGLRQQVRFVGYLSRELLDCYRAGDLFVFSSKTETQCLVLLEALALGVPVVSTAHMGTADIVNPQRGAHAAPDDEAQFAQIVVDLLNDPQRRAAMSAAARVYAATWSAAAMADRLTGLYSQVIAQAARNSPVSQPV